MRTVTVIGGWYGDARPNGDYAVQVMDADGPVGIETRPIDLIPPLETPVGFKDTMLFVRIPMTGEFKFAGQSWAGQGTIEYVPGKGYGIVTPYSYGVNPVIYDAQGVLQIASPIYGSQGFRYADGLDLITGDMTVNAQTIFAAKLGIRDLWEWSYFNGVAVGQGQGGAVVVYKGARYLLEPGNCAAIRFSRVGEDCAVTVVKPLERLTKLWWFRVEEIATLPLEVPVVVPVPVPEVEMVKPEVTVDRFAFTKDNHMSDGEKLVFHDRENAQGAKVRVWVEGGSMRMSIEYPGIGLGETGARREVR